LIREWYINVITQNSKGKNVTNVFVKLFRSFDSLYGPYTIDYFNGSTGNTSHINTTYIEYEYNKNGGSFAKEYYSPYYISGENPNVGYDDVLKNLSGNQIGNRSIILHLNAPPVVILYMNSSHNGTFNNKFSYIDNIYFRVNATDINNDTVNLNITIYNSSFVFKNFTISNITRNNLTTIYLINHTSLKPNENWSCRVLPYDNYRTGYSKYVYHKIINYPPIANNDSYVAVENRSEVLTVLKNDSDYENHNLRILYVTLPTHGSITSNQNINLTYLANANYLGYDNFSYVFKDEYGKTAEGFVKILVVNGLPFIKKVYLDTPGKVFYNNSNLYCYADADDYDTPKLYINWTWYKNGEIFKQDQTGLLNRSTLYVVSNITSNYTNVGDNWTCSVIAYDGKNYSINWTNTSTVTILKYKRAWKNIIIPGGVFEPDDGHYYSGTHIHTFTITFENLTLNSTDTLVCLIKTSDGSIKNINISGITLVNQTYGLNYTLSTSDSIIYKDGNGGYIPWKVEECYIVDSKGQRLYRETKNDWTKENKSPLIYVHSPGYWSLSEITAAVSCANNPGKYFNNSMKCSFDGDTMFALQMRNGNPVDQYCYNLPKNESCSDTLCQGILFPYCKSYVFHPGYNFTTFDPNGFASYTETLNGLSGTFTVNIDYTRYVNSNGTFIMLGQLL